MVVVVVVAAVAVAVVVVWTPQTKDKMTARGYAPPPLQSHASHLMPHWFAWPDEPRRCLFIPHTTASLLSQYLPTRGVKLDMKTCVFGTEGLRRVRQCYCTVTALHPQDPAP